MMRKCSELICFFTSPLKVMWALRCLWNLCQGGPSDLPHCWKQRGEPPDQGGSQKLPHLNSTRWNRSRFKSYFFLKKKLPPQKPLWLLHRLKSILFLDHSNVLGLFLYLQTVTGSWCFPSLFSIKMHTLSRHLMGTYLSRFVNCVWGNWSWEGFNGWERGV